MEPNKNHYSVPLAIVAAGLLIAGALYYRPAPPGGGAGPAAAFSLDQVPKLAAAASVDETLFNACWASGRHADKVSKQAEEAINLGGLGTPFSIIITPSGETIVLPGAVPPVQLASLFDAILNGETPPEAVVTLPGTLSPIGLDDHVRGQPDAPIKLIEYSDLDCPFCKRFHEETMNPLLADSAYADKITWVYRHWPLTAIHPNAGKEAEAAECVAELGGNDKFWDFLDKIFAAH